MKFEPVTQYYAECAETGCRIIKHCPLGDVEYAAWHPQGGFLRFRLATAKDAAQVCREYYQKNNGGMNG